MTIQLVSGVLSLFTPSATIRSASMSKPESVSSRMLSLGSSMAIWNISFLFFSPPEKPSFTERLANLLSSSTISRFWRMSFKNSLADKAGSPLYLRCSFTAARIKLTMLTPGISTGYWKDRNKPSWLLSSALKARRSFPSKVTLPFVTS